MRLSYIIKIFEKGTAKAKARGSVDRGGTEGEDAIKGTLTGKFLQELNEKI